MPDAAQEPGSPRSRRWDWRLVPALVAGGLLAALAALSVVNSFIVHMTPDISIYLLHARTFVETLNRFTLSWVNKGILLTFLLAPAVRLFGPTVWGAALVQCCTHAVAFYFLYQILRGFAPRASSGLIVLIGICVVFSPHLWGGKERPEDFALACAAVCLYAALRAAPGWWIAGGAMVGCCALTKITLVAAPAAVLLAAAVADAVKPAAPERRRSFGRALFGNLARTAAGFIVVVGLAAVWIALFDDLGGCWLQTVAWPLHSRGRSMLDPQLYVSVLRLIRRCRLEFLFAGCVVGLAYGWHKGYRRAAFLAGIFLLAEFLRIAAEGAQFPYLTTLMIVPLLVGASLFGCGGKGHARRSLAWMAPLVLAAPVLLTAFVQEGRPFELRAVRRLPSPSEYLAERMRPLYRPGETVLVNFNEHHILLLLNAPRPEPILELHFHLERAPEEERLRTVRHYAEFPPDWILTSKFPQNPVEFKTLGWVDGAYYVYLRPSKAALEDEAKKVNAAPPRTGAELTPMVPTSRLYRLEVDIGCMQAWHLAPAAGAAALPGRLDDRLEVPGLRQPPPGIVEVFGAVTVLRQ